VLDSVSVRFTRRASDWKTGTYVARIQAVVGHSRGQLRGLSAWVGAKSCVQAGLVLGLIDRL